MISCHLITVHLLRTYVALPYIHTLRQRKGRKKKIIIAKDTASSFLNASLLFPLIYLSIRLSWPQGDSKFRGEKIKNSLNIYDIYRIIKHRIHHPKTSKSSKISISQLSRNKSKTDKTTPPDTIKMLSLLDSFIRWCKRKNYQYEVTFAIYMLTPTEKCIFSKLKKSSRPLFSLRNLSFWPLAHITQANHPPFSLSFFIQTPSS